MPRQRQHGVAAVHADSIIRDAHQRLSAIFDGDGDRGGTRIERVLDKFLDDRRGPFDHFARGDLVSNGARQNGDSRHVEGYCCCVAVGSAARSAGGRVRSVARRYDTGDAVPFR